MANEFGPTLERLGVLRDLGEPPRIMNPTYRDRAISATAPVMQWWQSLSPANKELTESQAKAQALKSTKRIFGDIEAENIMDSLGILDFTPAGLVFAGQEAYREFGEAEKPTDYILPTVGLGLSAIEAYPLTKPLVTTATKPLRNFLGSLANKTSPEPIDMSRRTLLKGAVAAPIVAGALSQIPLSKIAKDLKPVAEKVKFKLNLSSLESFQNKVEEFFDLALEEGDMARADIIENTSNKDLFFGGLEQEIAGKKDFKGSFFEKMINEIKDKNPGVTDQQIFDEFSDLFIKGGDDYFSDIIPETALNYKIKPIEKELQ